LKVTCDKCQISFYPMIKEENKQVGEQNITRTFLVCPNCGKQYDCYYDNQKTLILKKQIGKALESARVETNKANELRILKGIEKKKRQLKKEERILQTLYNKGE
jgi:DNA-directed RNA polymerase subunit M/transcription elongation factor TFIIS